MTHIVAFIVLSMFLCANPARGGEVAGEIERLNLDGGWSLAASVDANSKKIVVRAADPVLGVVAVRRIDYRGAHVSNLRLAQNGESSLLCFTEYVRASNHEDGSSVLKCSSFRVSVDSSEPQKFLDAIEPTILLERCRTYELAVEAGRVSIIGTKGHPHAFNLALFALVLIDGLEVVAKTRIDRAAMIDLSKIATSYSLDVRSSEDLHVVGWLAYERDRRKPDTERPLFVCVQTLDTDMEQVDSACFPFDGVDPEDYAGARLRLAQRGDEIWALVTLAKGGEIEGRIASASETGIHALPDI